MLVITCGWSKLLSVVTLITATPLEGESSRSLFGRFKSKFTSTKNQLNRSESAPASQSAPLTNHAESSVGPIQSMEHSEYGAGVSEKSNKVYSCLPRGMRLYKILTCVARKCATMVIYLIVRQKKGNMLDLSG
jgi:hypothetical protein